jgi:hypothetical protein
LGVSPETWKNGLTRRRNYLAEEGKTCRYASGVIAGQFLKERDQVPNRCIAESLTLREHRAHVDAMFDLQNAQRDHRASRSPGMAISTVRQGNPKNQKGPH